MSNILIDYIKEVISLVPNAGFSTAGRPGWSGGIVVGKAVEPDEETEEYRDEIEKEHLYEKKGE